MATPAEIRNFAADNLNQAHLSALFHLKLIAYRPIITPNPIIILAVMNNIKKLTDEALVAMYAEGNDNAFDVLLSRYQDKLFTYILKLTHDEDRANDVFQETFVKVIMSLRSGAYTESGRFYGWLTRIAHNITIDGYRDVCSENTISNDESDGLLLNNAQIVDQSVESDIMSEQLLDDVQVLMNRLPEEQRRVMYMRIYQDMSFKEIAEETGVGINTALGRMHYATLNLRRMANEANIFID